MMPVIRIADTESDGFVDVATRMWCLSAIDYEDDDDAVVHFGPDDTDRALVYLHECDVIVGHNFIKHDLPLLDKLYSWKPKSHQVVVDTLTFSRMLNPKRPRPIGYTGKGMHSVEAWGYRLGRGKPDHEDWSKYTPEMRVRCNEDTIINLMILKELERESEEQDLFFHKARH
jgi:DNA polymerase-1